MLDTQYHSPSPPGPIPGGYTPPPKATGWRRITAAQLKTEELLRNWRGLPYKVEKPSTLLGVFKSAAPYIGVPRRLVDAMDWLFQFTHPQDWDKSSRPIVWPSAELMADELELSRTQTKAIVRDLVEAGLVVMKDSPNGKRYGHRNRRGEIVEAFGFDLSPLAVRHQEFLDAADAARQDRKTRKNLRRRATVCGRRCEEILKTAEEWEIVLDPEICDPIETTEMVADVRRLAAASHNSIDHVTAGVEAVERKVTQVQEQLANALKLAEITENTDPKGPEYRPHIYLQSNDKSIIENVEPKVTSESVDNFTAKTAEDGPGLTITVTEAVELFPRIGLCLQTKKPTWSDFTDAADILRIQMGIGKHLWGQACVEMGRSQAAIAIGIISLKPENHFTSGKGNYLYGIVRKHEEGTLHLERTISGLKEKQRQKLYINIRH